jgi:predicted dienelactone hydrolase
MAAYGCTTSRRNVLIAAAALPLLFSCATWTPQGGAPGPARLTLHAPDGRAISVSEWRPQGPQAGFLVFSHGAGLAPDQYLRVIEPLVAAGWHVFAPLHTDSEQHPDRADYAGFETWRTRIEDMRALSGHIGDRPFVAAGHSYGGLTALVMGGAGALVPDGITGSLADSKVSCVLALSPPGPIPGFVTLADYALLSVPALIQTGTLDIPAGMQGMRWEDHLAAYDAAIPDGDRYALVLEGVDHYFGGAIGRLGPTDALNGRQLALTVEIARQFLAAHALGQPAARRALAARISEELPVRLLRK